MCYRDRTWCNFRDCHQFGVLCDRSLTAEVMLDAREWWEGENPPIAIYSDRPPCFIKGDAPVSMDKLDIEEETA